MNPIELNQKIRSYIWATMEVVENHKDRPDVAETGKEKIETLLEAEKAVEKQIPKQAIGTEANLQNRYCPSCNEWMAFEKVGKVKYCPSCGQALSWD